MNKTTYCIIVLCLFIGCVICPPGTARSEQDELLKRPETEAETAVRPDKGFAGVYIIRHSDLFLFEKFYVYVDKLIGPNRVGYTKGMQHIYFSVLPGKHKITSEGKNRKSLIVDVKEGETIYIEQNPRRGGIGVNQDSLELLNQKEGAYYLGLTTQGVVDVRKTNSRFSP
jgi:hypothetical protein